MLSYSIFKNKRSNKQYLKMMISPEISNCHMFSPISSAPSLMPQTMAYESSITDAEQLPRSFNLLKDEDKVEYISMKNRFREEINLSRHGERLDVFISRLKKVRNYVNKDSVPSNRWKRMVVCGIMFLDNFDALAINIQQLKILLGKCKSSINGSLQQLGYIAKPSTHEINQEIAQQVPLFKDDYLELKKWTIRYGKFPESDSFSKGSQKMVSQSNADDYHTKSMSSKQFPKLKKKIQLQKKVKQIPQFIDDNSVGIYNNNYYNNAFQPPIALSPPQPLSCIMNTAVAANPIPPQIPMMSLSMNECQMQTFIPTDINHPNMYLAFNYQQIPNQQQQTQLFLQPIQQQIHPQEVQVNQVNADDIMKQVHAHFPCPAKCRHKYYDILYSSTSIQTEA